MSQDAVAQARGYKRRMFLPRDRVERLTNDPNNDLSPAWSPEGAKIAFDRDMDGNNHELYVTNADGTGERRLTDTWPAIFPRAWSPGGTKMAYFRPTTTNRPGRRERWK